MRRMGIRTIWCYDLPVTDEQFVAMPRGARMLSHVVASDRVPLVPGMEAFTVWALVDPLAGRVEQCIRVLGTGHEIPDLELSDFTYVGTFPMHEGKLVFHVFHEAVT